MTDETRIILDEISTLKSDIKDIRFSIKDIKSNINGIKSNINGIKSNINGITSNINDIQVSLENETNRNIKLIAEGHLDLTRKLNEVLKVSAENEMLPIRMNILENEVRRLKERVDAIA